MKAFLFFLFVRLASVYLVQTFYVPDEYWQSLEVAHKMVFGTGESTWEWSEGIRSYIYPGVIALVYKVLLLVNLDSVQLLVIAPRVLQAILSAYADYRFYRWTKRSKWAMFLISSGWFWFYTGSRTLTNTFEASLTMIALSQFPWESYDEETTFLIPVILAAFTRPTAIIPWIPICLHHLKKSKIATSALILKRYIPLTLLIGGLATAIDSYFYGRFIMTPFEFFKFNVIEGIGAFYGSLPWYWYWAVGLWTVLGIASIPFAIQVFTTLRHYEDRKYETHVVLLGSIATTVAVCSFLPHKEFRFLLSVYPMCIYLAYEPLSKWSMRASSATIWIAALAILVGNVVPAGYFSYVHKRGTLDVMPVLRDEALAYKQENGANARILFLMPCHSTPANSHLHSNVTLRFLKCEPNLLHKANHIDEAEVFFKDPSKWIRAHVPVHPPKSMPSHLVMYDTLVQQIRDFLLKYEPIHTFFYADVFTDRREGQNIVVYKRINTDPPQTTD